ncbi:hypothetical protein [Paragemmobacter ruber]|uniref:PepSY domain-containing protein n=1 Tax=Paragemmobacter ruber TaxID=1985673 RepID=A0ABW9Y5M6_9RHOB|nr:hypothetical protein [Rhodobacter ruber]NBE07713.1 hypothetical protein [Rhodobacter ruber]
MMGRKVMGALVAGAMGATPALADGFSAGIVEQLQAEGFKTISRERTWLGRTRITAEGELGHREIVINPNNGEILRDLFVEANNETEGATASLGDGGTTSSFGKTDDLGEDAASLRDKFTDKDWADNDWGDRGDVGWGGGDDKGGEGGGEGGEGGDGGAGGKDN